MPNQPIPGAPHHRRGGWITKFMRVEVFIVLLGAALLLAAVALYAGFSNPGTESKQVNKSEYQAVFLTNGQVYFGHITDMNAKYMVLQNIFYIESSNANNSANTNQTQQSQTTNYTLRKLGVSELHQPEDKMVVNKDTVTFWENLKGSSQVVTKITEYYKNPSK